MPKQLMTENRVTDLSKQFSSSCLSSPLNLSVGSTSNMGHSSNVPGSTTEEATENVEIRNINMPYLILASGQILKRVQEAQLLIPTTKGKY